MDFVVKIVDFKSWEIMRKYPMNRQCINNWVIRFMFNVYICAHWYESWNLMSLSCWRSQGAKKKVGCRASRWSCQCSCYPRCWWPPDPFNKNTNPPVVSFLKARASAENRCKEVLHIHLHASLVWWSATTLGSPSLLDYYIARLPMSDGSHLLDQDHQLLETARLWREQCVW